mmetsp:Transcript_7550/g.12496  ORF Transcript_7550/g.12496 Transcript_7550/m.12496 type:complete len:578 (+) Transcript_7550:133-1866(+)
MKNYHSITIQVDDDGSTNLDHHLQAKEGNPHPQDHLVPPFFSSQQDEEQATKSDRPSSLLVGTFNLIATILGGGVLTLPIAFQKCGVAVTTIFMFVSAFMTYMSLMMLCYCSRRSGGSSYGEVVRSAFGERAEVGVNLILFVYISFVVAAFMVLIRDIWTPLVGMFLGKTEDDEGHGGVSGDQVLLGFMIFLLPFLFQRSLHALKWNCYIGFASIIILCSALVRGGFQRQHNLHLADEPDDDGVYNIEWFKVPTVQDSLFAFPIIMLAFLCQFNVLSIQNTLQRPTRKRMSEIVGMSVGASMILMYLFGLGGYMMYGSSIQGNVLLNISVDKSAYADESLYWLFLLGRVGCGTTLVLALPLVSKMMCSLGDSRCETFYSTVALLITSMSHQSFLPGRDALLEIIDVWFHHSHHRSNSAETEHICWNALHKFNKNETPLDAAITTEQEIEEIETQPLNDEHDSSAPKPTILIRDRPIQQDYVFRNSVLHYGSTLLIVTYCFIGATRVAGVATIWSLVGSSLAFFIAFILPFASFIVIEKGVTDGNDRLDGWISIARVMLAVSIVGAVICTWNRLSTPV